MIRQGVTIILVVVGFTADALADPANSGVLDSLRGRQAFLGNLVAKYRTTVTYTPVPELLNHAVVEDGSQTRLLQTGTALWEGEYSALEGMKRYDANLLKRERVVHSTRPRSEEVLTAKAYSNERVEILRKSEGRTAFVGQITDESPLPEPDIEAGLGLRTPPGDVSIDWTSDRDLTTEQLDGGVVVLQKRDAQGRIHELMLDADLGYAITGYKRTIPPDNWISVEMRASNFKEYEGIMLPTKVVIKTFSRRQNGDVHNVKSIDVEVDGYLINDPTNSPERYRIKWPPGTLVQDLRSGISFRVDDDKLGYINDAEIASRAMEEIAKDQADHTVSMLPTQPEPNAMPSAADNRIANRPHASNSTGINGWLSWIGAGIAGAISLSLMAYYVVKRTDARTS